MSAILEAIAGTPFAHVRDRLDSLGAAPPQVLLLEGGTEAQRLDAALYWACRANSPDAERDGSPCLNCPTCRQMAAWENLDLSAYDGRISNTQDQTEPGPIRALTIENVRELKSKLGSLSQANITVRNFPLSVADLRRRLKLSEGGSTYIFATTLADKRHVLLVCRKIG